MRLTWSWRYLDMFLGQIQVKIIFNPCLSLCRFRPTYPDAFIVKIKCTSQVVMFSMIELAGSQWTIERYKLLEQIIPSRYSAAMLCINVATILARVAHSKHTSITSSRDLHEASKLCDNVEYNLVVVTVTSDSSFEVDEEYWPRATGESLKLMYNMSRRWCWLSIFLDVECPQRASTRRFGPGSESLYEASKASREVRTVGFRCKSSKIQSHLRTGWTEAN